MVNWSHHSQAYLKSNDPGETLKTENSLFVFQRMTFHKNHLQSQQQAISEGLVRQTSSILMSPNRKTGDNYTQEA